MSANNIDDMGVKAPVTEFPPPGFRETPVNHLLVNALDLTAPASSALIKNRKSAWVQLAGHPGSFAPAGHKSIWKKRMNSENRETLAYRGLMKDVVRDLVPKFHREVHYNGDMFIEIEDLLQQFTDASTCIMDIKMGTRTFLESEVGNPTLRGDLYDKMVKIDPSEPTPQENQQKAITKLRYMQFREKGSSTSTLGFRLEAIKMSGESPNTELKKVKTEEQVVQLIKQFLQGQRHIQKKIIKRFKEIQKRFEASKFFKSHEVIGSSLLILYDHDNRAGAWMIDFAKTVPTCPVTHRAEWQPGNHEDGYLSGIDNLIRIFKGLNLGPTPSVSSSNCTTRLSHSQEQCNSRSPTPEVCTARQDTTSVCKAGQHCPNSDTVNCGDQPPGLLNCASTDCSVRGCGVDTVQHCSSDLRYSDTQHSPPAFSQQAAATSLTQS